MAVLEHASTAHVVGEHLTPARGAAMGSSVLPLSPGTALSSMDTGVRMATMQHTACCTDLAELVGLARSIGDLTLHVFKVTSRKGHITQRS